MGQHAMNDLHNTCYPCREIEAPECGMCTISLYVGHLPIVGSSLTVPERALFCALFGSLSCLFLLVG